MSQQIKSQVATEADFSNNLCAFQENVIARHNTGLNILRSEYYKNFHFTSKAIEIKKLGAIWKSFYDKVKENKDELECVLAFNMLQKDAFSFIIYEEITTNHIITFKEALSTPPLSDYLNKEGLTDSALAYLNGLQYFNELDSLSEEIE